MSVNVFGQSPDCAGAEPFCTGTSYNFPASTNTSAETGPDYGCMCEQPNPVWYYCQISSDGDLNIHITSTAGDVDFAAWGPFSSPTCGSALSASGAPACTVENFNQPYGNLVDCAYSTASTEDCFIPNAHAGEVYMICITNYENVTGNISFSQTSGNGGTDCSIVVPFTLTTSETDVLCNGGSTGSASVTVTDGTSPFTYNWSNGFNQGPTTATTSTNSNISAGTYYVTVTDDGGFTLTETIVVNEPSVISASTSVTNETCDGADNGSINLTVSGGTPGYSYVWNPGQTSQNISGLLDGTYTVTITDANGCHQTASVTVAAGPPVVAVFSTPANQCLSGNSFSFNASGSSSGTYTWNFGDGNAGSGSPVSHTYSSSGTFTVTLTVDNGLCSDQIQHNITVYPQPTATASNNGPICAGNPLILTGGANGMSSYAWSGPNSFSSGSQSPTVNGSATTSMSGTYTITVTDGNGCQSTATTNATVNPLPTVNAGSNSPICDGENILLTETGGSATSWSWTGPNGFTSTSQNSTINGAGTAYSGTYTVVGTIVATGCSASDNVDVTVNSLPIVYAGADQSIPNGTWTTINDNTVTPAGTYTYSWTPTGSMSDPSVFHSTTTSLSSTTQFIFTVTDQTTSCTSSPDTVIITVTGGTLAVSVENDTICNGESANLNAVASGGSGSYTYSWTSNPAGFTSSIANPIVSPTSTTIYNISVNDGFNTVNSSMTVVVNPLPNVTATSDATGNSICLGDNVTLTGTGNADTYTWDNGITDGIAFSPSTTQTYTVIGDNTTTGCSNSDQITITVNSLPTASASNNGPICSGNPLNLIGGVGGLSVYAWSGPNAYLNSSQSPTVSVSATSTLSGTYTITVTDANGCQDTASTIVTVYDLPNATAANNGPVCEGAQLMLTGGDTLMNSYYWSGPNGYNIGAQCPIVSGSATTSMSGTYTLTITDGNGCQNTTSTNVTVNALPTASATNNGPLCENDTLTLTGGSSGMTSYLWDGPNGYNDTVQNPVVSNSVTSVMSGTYNITITDNNGCQNSASTTVTVNPLPTATALNNGPVCIGTALSLTGGTNGLVNYSWSGPNGYSITNQNPIVSSSATALMAGIYTITVTNGSNCTDTASTNVVINSLPISTATSNSPVCKGSELNLTGGPNNMNNYTWTGPNGYYSNSQSPIVSGFALPVMAGTYSLNVTDSNGCINDSSIIVVVNQLPIVIANSNASNDAVCSGDSIILYYITNADTAYWSNPVVDSVAFIPNATQSYFVTGINTSGCINTDTILVTVDPLPVISNISSTDVTCYGNEDGTISLVISGGTPGYSYLWNNNATTSTISNLGKGYYSVIVSDTNNCSVSTDSILISEPDSLYIVISDITNPLCYNGNDGSIIVYGLGGTQPYSYLWSDSDSSTTATINNISSGVYTVTLTDFNSCQNTAVVTLNNPQGMSVTPDYGVDSITYQGYINLNITGGASPYSYLWSNSEVTQNISGLSSGNYIVTITDFNSCAQIDTFNIEIPLIVPTIITPNGDGYNDTWQITNIESYNDVHIEIYDRWGDMIFTFDGTGLEYTDTDNQWDGTFNGKTLPFSSYVFIVTLNDNEQVYNGVVTIKR